MLTPKRIAALFAAFAIAGAALVAGATAASAAPSYDVTAVVAPQVTADEVGTAALVCESGNLCFWSGVGYTGARGRVAGNNPDWRAFPQAACATRTWHNCAASAANRGTKCSARLHAGLNYTDRIHTIPRGGNRPDLGDFSFRRITSSNSWVYCV